jgi:hypothetical protein
MTPSKDLNDHDLLIRIDERQEHLIEQFKDHLSKHLLFKMAVYGSVLSAISAVIVSVIVAVVK